MDEIIINVKEEKEKIIENIFNKNLNFSFLKFDNQEINNEYIPSQSNEFEDLNNNNYLEERANQNRQKITDEINQYIPNQIICNSQIPYLRKLPLIKDSN
jgi:hypothetical protein